MAPDTSYPRGLGDRTSPQPYDEREYLEQLINEHQAATFIGFAVKTLRNWRVSGAGPAFVRASGRAVRYRRKDLIEWAEAQLVSSTSETA